MAQQQDLFGYDNVELSEEEKKYSLKVKSPVYTPRPTAVKYVQECADYTKYKNLCRRIDQADITQDEKNFLKFAATRHIVFNYEKIADYYAGASKQMQALMEQSALVIIDFDKAIEQGYVILNDKMQKLYELELGES